LFRADCVHRECYWLPQTFAAGRRPADCDLFAMVATAAVPHRLAGPSVGATVATTQATSAGHSMDANEALEAIRTLARVALSMADEGLSLETLLEQYQRSLNGILVMAEKALPADKRRA
jgi:hypothetical protein